MITDKEAKQLRRKLERARSTLKIIHTWATFNYGSHINKQHIANACSRALRESEMQTQSNTVRDIANKIEDMY